MTSSELRALRRRIIDKMPEILEQIATERRHQPVGGDRDFRPRIISNIKMIAELELMSPSKTRRALLVVENNVGRLKQSIEKLPPPFRHLVRFEVEGLDIVEMQIKNQSGRTVANQKMLAAEVAHDLMLDYGGNVPTLTKGQPYIELANLLHFVAAGNEIDLKRQCGQYLANYKRDGIDLYQRRRVPGARPAQIFEIMRKHPVEEERQRRKSVVENWPPLAQVVDEVLDQ